MLLLHPYEGGHPDYDTAALIGRCAAAQSAHAPELVEMTSHHACGSALRSGVFLGGYGGDWEVALDEEGLARKEAMVAAYASQREALAPPIGSAEQFRRAPAADFTRPPHGGPLLYELRGWGDGPAWRRAIAPMAALAGLPSLGGERTRMASADRTTDHDTIRRWTEARGGIPTIVQGTVGLLRIDFIEGPQSGGREASLEEVSWDR